MKKQIFTALTAIVLCMMPSLTATAHEATVITSYDLIAPDGSFWKAQATPDIPLRLYPETGWTIHITGIETR